MDELRGDQAAWRFDGESIAIAYETKGWFKSPLLKLLGGLSVPLAAVEEVDFRPGAARKGGWAMNLRLRERMDPYAAVGAMLDERAQPFRLTGPASTELVAEYLADQVRFAAGQAGEPDGATPAALVPPLPLHVRTSEGTAHLDRGRLTLVWGGGHASGFKKKQQRREFDLADIAAVEWSPLDDWGWGFVRVITADGAGQAAAKPRNDLNVLRAGEEGSEIHQVFLLAATVTAHMWARDARARPAPGAGGTPGDGRTGRDDDAWWRDTARSALDAVRRSALALNRPGGAPAESDGPGADGGAAPGEGRASEDVRVGGADTAWIFEQIERLGELHAKGLLTDEEFSAKKAELLGRI
ncbi:DUF4429 domain-containing protein [Nocardiopsis sp. NPDC101807]|uniref:DUF4429 domain-containing protein n=1 Tax=Nocardiopsis sp. NPDC101807 TaxID=3364339 RepID=UPI0037F8AD5B